jgi:hypothetical protein
MAEGRKMAAYGDCMREKEKEVVFDHRVASKAF